LQETVSTHNGLKRQFEVPNNWICM